MHMTHASHGTNLVVLTISTIWVIDVPLHVVYVLLGSPIDFQLTHFSKHLSVPVFLCGLRSKKGHSRVYKFNFSHDDRIYLHWQCGNINPLCCMTIQSKQKNPLFMYSIASFAFWHHLSLWAMSMSNFCIIMCFL